MRVRTFIYLHTPRSVEYIPRETFPSDIKLEKKYRARLTEIPLYKKVYSLERFLIIDKNQEIINIMYFFSFFFFNYFVYLFSAEKQNEIW